MNGNHAAHQQNNASATNKASARSESLRMATAYLHQRVRLRIDRPAGSHHPTHGFRYPVNYGHVPGTTAPDGEELDGYYLDTSQPLEEAEGICIAVIHRHFDDDDKLVVVPEHLNLTDEQITQLVEFQEIPGHYEIVRHKGSETGSGTGFHVSG